MSNRSAYSSIMPDATTDVPTEILDWKKCGNLYP